MSKSIAQHTLIEHQLLKHLMEALRITLEWKPPRDGLSRKLVTLRFMTGSLQRHVERMLAMEEKDGYMLRIVATCPHLSDQVDALRRQHDQFREELREIVIAVEGVSAGEEQRIALLCDRLVDLLDKLDEHSKQEIDLVQEALLREEGGEG